MNFVANMSEDNSHDLLQITEIKTPLTVYTSLLESGATTRVPY